MRRNCWFFGGYTFFLKTVPTTIRTATFSIIISRNAYQFRFDVYSSNIFPSDSKYSFKLGTDHILSKSNISNPRIIISSSGSSRHSQRHDTQFQILINSDSFLPDIHVILINYWSVNGPQLLIIYVLVYVFVAESSATPIDKYAS